MINMDINKMIKYFEGVKAQHIALNSDGYKNIHSESITRTYDFVISKLKEWKTADS
jgi:hypothetical protein